MDLLTIVAITGTRVSIQFFRSEVGIGSKILDFELPDSISFLSLSWLIGWSEHSLGTGWVCTATWGSLVVAGNNSRIFSILFVKYCPNLFASSLGLLWIGRIESFFLVAGWLMWKELSYHSCSLVLQTDSMLCCWHYFIYLLSLYLQHLQINCWLFFDPSPLCQTPLLFNFLYFFSKPRCIWPN